VTPRKAAKWSWRSQAFRGVVFQVVAVAAIAFSVWYLAHNTLANMQARGIQSGFDFLQQPAGFDIGESLIPYDALDKYWKAFLVGVLNTLRVAIAGIVLATVVGTAVGIGRFSRNAILRGLCYAYVELFRNVPVLCSSSCGTCCSPIGCRRCWTRPRSRASSTSARRVLVPHSRVDLRRRAGALRRGAGLVAAWFYRRWAVRQFELSGRYRSLYLVPMALVLAGAFIGLARGGNADRLERSEARGVRDGGRRFREPRIPRRPFRAGALHGCLHLRSRARGHRIRLARAGRGGGKPRALARAVDAPRDPPAGPARHHSADDEPVPQHHEELVARRRDRLSRRRSIANTALNQTGRAVECIAIIMAVYLTTSLTTSAFMNWYNRRAAIQER
jgi:general L-amino acid transport system permease protein